VNPSGDLVNANGNPDSAHVPTPLGRLARQIRSPFVFDQDGDLLLEECRLNQELTP